MEEPEYIKEFKALVKSSKHKKILKAVAIGKTLHKEILEKYPKLYK